MASSRNNASNKSQSDSSTATAIDHDHPNDVAYKRNCDVIARGSYKAVKLTLESSDDDDDYD